MRNKLILRNQIDVILLIIFIFGIIGSKTVEISGETLYIELITIIAFIWSIKESIKYIRNWQEYSDLIKKNKKLIYPIIFLVLSNIIYTVIMKPQAIVYVINKFFPYIFFIIIFIRVSKSKKSDIKKYINIVAIIFIVAFIFSLIMYMFKYTNAALSFDSFLKFQSFEETFSLHGEIRLHWLLSHKSRYTMYCLIGVLFIIKSSLSKNKKIFGIILASVCGILSNSMIGIVIFIMITIIAIFEEVGILEKLIKIIINNKKNTIGILIILGVLGIGGICMISQVRDISTLGARTFIWEAGIEQVIEVPKGIIEMPDALWIKGEHEGIEYFFSNAHNMYINEFIEGGVLLGIIYILSIGAICIYYFKTKEIVFSMFLIMFMGIYSNFESVNSKEMPYIIFMSFSIFYWYKKLKIETEEDDNIYKNGENENEEIISNNMYV